MSSFLWFVTGVTYLPHDALHLAMGDMELYRSYIRDRTIILHPTLIMTTVNGQHTTVSDVKRKQYEAAMHTRGLTIGPMAPQCFLDKFLPTTRPSCTKPFTSVINSIPTRRRFKPFVSTHVIEIHGIFTRLVPRDRSRQ